MHCCLLHKHRSFSSRKVHSKRLQIHAEAAPHQAECNTVHRPLSARLSMDKTPLDFGIPDSQKGQMPFQ